MLLPCSLADHHSDRLVDDDQVKPPALVFNIFQVVLDPFLKIRAGAARAADLPQAGDAGAHAQPRFAPRRAILIFMMRARPRADDRHVAEQHVPKLRQLVELVPAKDFADAREARIVLDEKLRAVGLIEIAQLLLDLLGVFAHGAEFPAAELASANSFA